MWRHNPQTHRLVELLAELGELELVRATFAFPLEDQANIRMRPELDGGALMDVGCYCVSATRLIGGEPERVYAEQTLGPTGVDVLLSAILRWPSGLTAQISCSLGVSHESLEVIGTKGVLMAPDPWHCRRGLIVLNGEPVEVAPVSSYRLELENVASAVRGTEALLLGREDALGQARTIQALYRSAALGAPVLLGDGLG
jgi:predicted dehydrogenase